MALLRLPCFSILGDDIMASYFTMKLMALGRHITMMLDARTEPDNFILTMRVNRRPRLPSAT